MAIPSARPDLDDLVKRWYSRLDSLRIGALAAQSTMASTSDDVILMWQRISGFQSQVGEIQAHGFGPTELAPVIERKFGIADATSIFPTYVAVRDAHAPAIKALIEAQDFGQPLTDLAQGTAPMGAQAQSDLSALLTALIAEYE